MTRNDLILTAIHQPDDTWEVEPEGNLWRAAEARWEPVLIKKVLERVNGNQVKASELLGINRLTLRKKIEQYKLGS